MEVYKSETREVLGRFLSRRITFQGCIAALDSALAGLLPRLRPEELPALRELMMANNEAVMKEMERRSQRKKAKAPVPETPQPTVAIPNPLATMEKVHARLQEELKNATERAASASAAFLDVTSQVPSGLPHPDGTQRIRNLP